MRPAHLAATWTGLYTRRCVGWVCRLGAEAIDLYQMHAWDPLTPIRPSTTWWSARPSWMIPAARHNGLGILAWSPLASGFLTGKYTRDQPRPADTRAGQGSPLYDYTSSNYEHSDQTWSAVDAVRQVAKQVDATPAQVAVSWVINRPGVVAAIVGARTTEQLNTILRAADLHLPTAATDTLDSATAPNPAAYPYGPFGAAQRDRVANGPEALGEPVKNFAENSSH